MSEVTEEPTHPQQPEHRINYSKRKIVVVIDKDHFTVCKKLLLEHASDEEFSNLLHIPLQKVRIFKHKMAIFENKLRTRRRMSRLNNRRFRRKSKRLPAEEVGNLRKKDMSIEERFKCARDLILQNYTTSEISRVLKISIRSVIRFRQKIRDMKQKMQEEGDLEFDEDEWEFRHLTAELKCEKIKELQDQGLSATEIAKIFKITDRSVRRWRQRMEEMEQKQKFDVDVEEGFSDLTSDQKCEKISEMYQQGMTAVEIGEAVGITDRSVRRWKMRIDEMRRNPEKFKKEKEEKKEPQKSGGKNYARKLLDRKVVENVIKLLESGATNKEISEKLNIPIRTVMFILKKVWRNCVDDVIDDTPEKIIESENRKRMERKRKMDAVIESRKVKKEKVDKKVVKVVKVEEEEAWDPHGQYNDEYFDDSCANDDDGDDEDVEMVQVPFDPLSDVPTPTPTPKKLQKTDKNKLTDKKKSKEKSSSSSTATVDKNEDENEHSSKMQTGLKLLKMNVKTADIIKMLKVSERTVSRWKKTLSQTEKSSDSQPGHSVFENLLGEIKTEPSLDIDDD